VLQAELRFLVKHSQRSTHAHLGALQRVEGGAVPGGEIVAEHDERERLVRGAFERQRRAPLEGAHLGHAALDHAIGRIGAQAARVRRQRRLGRGAHIERAIFAAAPHAALSGARLRLDADQISRARVIVAPRAHIGRSARDQLVLQPKPASALALDEHVRDCGLRGRRLWSGGCRLGRLRCRRSSFRAPPRPAPRPAIRQQHFAMQRQRLEFTLRLRRIGRFPLGRIDLGQEHAQARVQLERIPVKDACDAPPLAALQRADLRPTRRERQNQ
jgi:hypothetical protein